MLFVYTVCIFVKLYSFESVGAILDSVFRSFRPAVRHNFVFAQYLEKYYIESNQILYVHLY